jgi:hypothetical protein
LQRNEDGDWAQRMDKKRRPESINAQPILGMTADGNLSIRMQQNESDTICGLRIWPNIVYRKPAALGMHSEHYSQTTIFANEYDRLPDHIFVGDETHFNAFVYQSCWIKHAISHI